MNPALGLLVWMGATAGLEPSPDVPQPAEFRLAIYH